MSFAALLILQTTHTIADIPRHTSENGIRLFASCNGERMSWPEQFE